MWDKLTKMWDDPTKIMWDNPTHFLFHFFILIWKKKMKVSKNKARTPLSTATSPPPPLAYFGNDTSFLTKMKFFRKHCHVFTVHSNTKLYSLAGIVGMCTLRDGYTPDASLSACGAQLGREGSLLFGALGWPQPFPPFPTFSSFLLTCPTLFLSYTRPWHILAQRKLPEGWKSWKWRKLGK